MSEARWLADLPEQARARLPQDVFEYVAQGAGEGVTAAEAGWAWRGHRLHPHVLRDVTHVDLGIDLLGRPSAVPWGIAPTTLQAAVHPEGELATARATAAAGGLMVVSSNAGAPVEEIAATGVAWWLQAYLPADRTLALPLLRRAVAAGAGAVVLTVDTPVVATKHRSERSAVESRFPDAVGANLTAGAADKALDLGPHDLDWLAEVTGLPVVVKGVLRPDDARRCAQAGVAAVWVSNHGGRQLDRAVSTTAALPEIVAAVGGDVQVYADGGIRSGLDVVTALALGADATFVGRSALYALVEGEAGVRRLHDELAVQTVEAMRLAGCSRVSDLAGIATPIGLTAL